MGGPSQQLQQLHDEMEKRAIFAAYYERHRWSLARHMRYLVPNQDIEDICQEACLHMWQQYFVGLAKPTPEVLGAFAQLLHKIARNRVIDCVRQNRAILFSLPDTESDDPKEYLLAGHPNLQRSGPEQVVHLQMCIEQTLAAMKPEQRVCVLLQTKWGFSQKEIAKQLGMDSKTVNSHVYRGSRQFTKIYAQLTGEDRGRGKGTGK